MLHLTLAEAVELAGARVARGEATAIAAVISAPPDGPPAGARMIVGHDEIIGSLGERLDPVVREDAIEMLDAGQSAFRSYVLRDEHIERTRPQQGNVDIFFEVLAGPPRLIIVGAGHIAVPLARLARILDFDVTVVDDRPQYANRERFPDATEICVGPYPETLGSLPLEADAHVVLVTRGHVHDQACLELVLGRSVRYVGMIGSRMRVRTVVRHLEEQGHDPAALARVHAPIGLEIGAQTPAEIAVAILAEIIAVRRQRRARSTAAGASPRD